MLKTYSQDGKLLVGTDGDFLKILGFVDVPADKNVRGQINPRLPPNLSDNDIDWVYLPIIQAIPTGDFAPLYVDQDTGQYRYTKPFIGSKDHKAYPYRIYYGYI